ncbi:hypothetical protein PICMEDRAFT_18003 [Pichia membranifaciens NRRL Y-2026]|uniref:Serine/threonine-protein kinase RAD53 n=1 Tax=Pichia membranifaciens NRRL Y-2026 TaxID=763406 RepID=A0A1E3NEN9_9ASCO|nr:hypothetical protein PICMEDRAFT_18003 [Pichia membranifaciens NRRL Y-2026]ODQ44589.1 hypothetical protein PICMEDRAFT_18003 [Pichia membranifaciens NRRL Y-2026]
MAERPGYRTNIISAPLKEIRNSVFGQESFIQNQEEFMNKVKPPNQPNNETETKKLPDTTTQPTQPSSYNPLTDPLGHELVRQGVLCRLIGRTFDETFHIDVKSKDGNKIRVSTDNNNTSNHNNNEVISNLKQEWIFGRNSHTCTYLLPVQSTRISNKHFKLWMNIDNDNNQNNGTGSSRQENNLMIQDLSTNGTWLNNSKLVQGRNYILTQGDEIAIGIGIEKDVARFVVHLPNVMLTKMMDENGSLKALSLEDKGVHKDFIIRDEIVGSGAFATVKKAIERSTGITFAAKIISKKKALGGMDGVSRELQILKKLDHPGIVRLKAFYEDDDNYYLVMEYISGGDLMDFVACNGAIDESASREIARQIMEAILYVHSKGISHRDLKPDNIMIAQDDPVVVKITDFGLAKSQEQESRMKTFCGTLAYLAPEVISNKKKQSNNRKRYLGNGRITEDLYSNKVDMWSIGCLLFVIMTAHLPFSGSTQDILFKHITNGDYHDKLLRSMDISIEGCDFISRLLEVDVALRLNAAQALQHPWFNETIDFPSQVSLSQHLSQSQRNVGKQIPKKLEQNDTDNKKSNNTRGKFMKDFKIPQIPKDRNMHEDSMNFMGASTSQIENSHALSSLTERQDMDYKNFEDEASSKPNTPQQKGTSSPSSQSMLLQARSKSQSQSHSQSKIKSQPKPPPATFMSLSIIQPGSLKTKLSTIYIPQGTPAFYIGRLDNLNVQMNDERISKIHCMIVKRRHPTKDTSSGTSSNSIVNTPYNLENNGFDENGIYSSPAMGLDDVWLLDFSTNTCYVNGMKIGKGKKIKLRDCDVLSLFVDKKHDSELKYLIRIVDTTGLYIDDVTSNLERKRVTIDESDRKLFETKLKEGLKQVEVHVMQRKRKPVESIAEHPNKRVNV